MFAFFLVLIWVCIFNYFFDRDSLRAHLFFSRLKISPSPKTIFFFTWQQQEIISHRNCYIIAPMPPQHPRVWRFRGRRQPPHIGGGALTWRDVGWLVLQLCIFLMIFIGDCSPRQHSRENSGIVHIVNISNSDYHSNSSTSSFLLYAVANRN